MSKKIHVAWPVLCKVELEDIIDKLNTIRDRFGFSKKDEGALISAMESAISASKEALEALEQTYG